MTMTEQTPKLDPTLLAILRCPLTGSPLQQEADELVAEIGGLRYPVRDGIPVMLIEEARLPAPFQTLEEFKAHHRDVIKA